MYAVLESDPTKVNHHSFASEAAFKIINFDQRRASAFGYKRTLSTYAVLRTIC